MCTIGGPLKYNAVKGCGGKRGISEQDKDKVMTLVRLGRIAARAGGEIATVAIGRLMGRTVKSWSTT